MHPNLLNAQEMKQQSQCIIYCKQISAPRRPATVKHLVAGVEATRRGTTSTAKATTTALATEVAAALASEVTAVAVIAADLAAITPAALAAALTRVALHTTGCRARGLLQGVGDNLLGKVEVLNALVGEVPVVPLPAELLSDVPTGLQGSQQLNHVDVLDGELLVIVLGLVAILLGNHDTLFEEVVVDDLAVLFRDEHCNKFGFDECAPM